MDGFGGDGGAAYERRFRSLFREGRASAFACDARGEVPLAALSARALENPRRAWSGTGRDCAMPSVQPRAAG